MQSTFLPPGEVLCVEHVPHHNFGIHAERWMRVYAQDGFDLGEVEIARITRGEVNVGPPGCREPIDQRGSRMHNSSVIASTGWLSHWPVG